MAEERPEKRVADRDGRPDQAFPVRQITIHGRQIAYRVAAKALPSFSCTG